MENNSLFVCIFSEAVREKTIWLWDKTRVGEEMSMELERVATVSC